ncbi:unnamed protein product [Prorocentrum cordatum]|uniref:C3H1-type domain-containing protein n=1 Tax=Prorocentrum cordatum TaxID=2364126 RepID=A0ABN9SW30_9DINO|nr:unnamed protein product [Polarella glacialis]CAK0836754.1 unnamed protein product [Polarella glacialis]
MMYRDGPECVESMVPPGGAGHSARLRMAAPASGSTDTEWKLQRTGTFLDVCSDPGSDSWADQLEARAASDPGPQSAPRQNAVRGRRVGGWQDEYVRVLEQRVASWQLGPSSDRASSLRELLTPLVHEVHAPARRRPRTVPPTPLERSSADGSSSETPPPMQQLAWSGLRRQRGSSGGGPTPPGGARGAAARPPRPSPRSPRQPPRPLGGAHGAGAPDDEVQAGGIATAPRHHAAAAGLASASPRAGLGARRGVVRRSGCLPSAGSYGHPELCNRPCWYWPTASGCRHNQACDFCHLPHPKRGSVRPERWCRDVLQHMSGGARVALARAAVVERALAVGLGPGSIEAIGAWFGQLGSPGPDFGIERGQGHHPWGEVEATLRNQSLRWLLTMAQCGLAHGPEADRRTTELLDSLRALL